MPRDAAGDVVELSVDVAASPATVWRCVSEPGLLSRWLSAPVTFEPRVGAPVQVDFSRYGTVVAGVVEELRPRELLVLTWGVASGPQAAAMPAGSTRVRIRLEPTPGGTRVTLRHEGLPTEQERRDHALGWHGYLGSLAGVAPVAAVEGGPEALWDDWFAAWAETDAARRDAVLARRLADDATYRDVHTDSRGRAGVSAWIAQCQTLFPGVRVVRDGDVLNSRGSLLVRWRVTGADGAVLARGTNFGRLTADGRLQSVDAFWEQTAAH